MTWIRMKTFWRTNERIIHVWQEGFRTATLRQFSQANRRMDNATYAYSTDCTPLTNCKSSHRPLRSTVINMGQPAKKPLNDYLIWSLCNTLYVNFCCLGFMALIYSIKARDQKTLGDMRAAQECSDKAKWYNILASGWNLLVPMLLLGAFVLLIVHLGSLQGTFDFFGEDGYQNFMKLFGR
ncbi:interferon-induced transmembrane protein 5 isoform X1 [Trichomycterus rosablanca]|uniref:interferon-induced transmembrane protein 5 isoform X1 n=2 Tax=Trichomycterus rosablanca TaxID=2290929 RepID=UPI002F35F8CD